MKLSVFLMLIGMMQVSANVYSQAGKVNVQVEQVSMSDLLWELQEKSDAVFVFNTKDLENLPKVSIDMKDVSIAEILDKLLLGTELEYMLDDNVVVIQKKLPKVIEEKLEVKEEQEKKELKGTVTDTDGYTLPGVSVVVKGTTTGVATDIDGNYTIEFEGNNIVLVYSFVGMLPQEIVYSGQVQQNVTLIADSKQMAEVVVTGLQTIEKGRATGSFKILKGEELDKVYSSDFRQKLEGAASGLYVDKDNNMVIRGMATLNANTKPLIVVDGIPLESSELNLNPNDIDQITVLKDAASASIWGVRAANGVVVITTKRGSKDGKLSVTYTGNLSIEDRVNPKDFHRLSGSEYANMEFDRALGKGLFSWSNIDGYTEIGEIYKDYSEKGNITLAEAQKKVGAIGAFDNTSQISDLFYQRAVVQQHNIALRTGNKKISHYFSLNYDDSKGMLVGNSSDKINFMGNTDLNISQGVDLQIGLRGTYLKKNMNGDTGLDLRPYERILDEDGQYANQYNTGASMEYIKLLEANGFKDWSQNNLQQMRMNDNTEESHNIATSLKLSVEPIKGLNFTTFGSYEIGSSENRNYYSEDHYMVRDLTNRFTQVDDTDTPEILAHHLPTSGGILDQAFGKMNSFVWRNTLKFSQEFNDFHIKLMAGNELYSQKTEYRSGRLWGYDDKTLTSQAVDLASFQQRKVKGFDGYGVWNQYSPGYNETIERFASYFGTVNLTYKNKYDLFASARLDKTNLLVNASEFRNNPSWSLGGKWHISEEEFFDSELFNNLAFKASYGLSGNIDKSTGPDIVGRAGAAYFVDGLNVVTITNPENKSLGWEKTYTLNLGIDFSLLNNRLNGTLEAYNKKSQDLLASVSQDPTTGWASMLKNAATVLNQGIDLSLNALILDGPVKWNTGINFSYNYNEVTDINYTPSFNDVLASKPMKGQPIGYIAAIRNAGLDATGETQIMKKGDDTPLPWNDLGKFRTDDLEYVGRSTPPVFGSFSNHIKYKDFTLGFMITYKLGHKVRLPNPDQSSFTSFQPNEWLSEKHRWMKPGDEATKFIPKLETTPGYVANNRRHAFTFSDKMVDDGDLIRLKSVSLAYDLNKLLKNSPIKGGSLRFSAENLCYWAANRYDLDSDYLRSTASNRWNVGEFSLPARSKFIMTVKLNF